MTTPKNTIGSQVSSVFSRSTTGAIGTQERAEARASARRMLLEREAGVARGVRDLELRADGSAVESRRWSSKPGRASARATGCVGFRATHEKSSTEPPIAPAVPSEPREPRVPAGAFAATTFAASDDATIGAMSCEPQRGCSFGAGAPPFSYVPIETCSAPW